MKYLDYKMIPEERLKFLSKDFTYGNYKVIATSGCFDVFHYGHLKMLSEAKALGDLLLVGVNSDNSIRKLNKSFTRPIHGEIARANVIAGLEVVDFVYIFNEVTPEHFLGILKPEVYVKGSDYLDKHLPERSVVESNGGTVKLLEYTEGYSTTSILRRISG